MENYFNIYLERFVIAKDLFKKLYSKNNAINKSNINYISEKFIKINNILLGKEVFKKNPDLFERIVNLQNNILNILLKDIIDIKKDNLDFIKENIKQINFIIKNYI
jgi:hypothetical protein